MDRDPMVSRRTALTVGAGLALSACGSARNPATPRSPSPTDTSTAASTPKIALPALEPWVPPAGEEQVAAKIAAVRRIETLGNTGTHRVRVIDAQYGGLLSDSASVLVVCEGWHLDGSQLTSDGSTYDVRVRLMGDGWQVTAIHPSDPGPATSGLSTAARHVLGSPRISLPPAAHADIASGAVHDTVLEAMLAVSRRWPIALSVIRSGHPLYVFGTSRLSDHPRGRAFDTWEINHTPVVAPGAPDPVVPAYMEALAALGSYNVGGPVLLGSAPQFFSDQTHHDHVHAGFVT